MFYILFFYNGSNLFINVLIYVQTIKLKPCSDRLRLGVWTSTVCMVCCWWWPICARNIWEPNKASDAVLGCISCSCDVTLGSLINSPSCWSSNSTWLTTIKTFIWKKKFYYIFCFLIVAIKYILMSFVTKYYKLALKRYY